MRTNFQVAKNMAKSMAIRFGIAYINFIDNDYYVTSCLTPNSIGIMRASGKFSCLMQKN